MTINDICLLKTVSLHRLNLSFASVIIILFGLLAYFTKLCLQVQDVSPIPGMVVSPATGVVPIGGSTELRVDLQIFL